MVQVEGAGGGEGGMFIAELRSKEDKVVTQLESASMQKTQKTIRKA
jgi:hypothetical protein